MSALNPLNYITSARDHDLQHANFLERQRNLHVQDRTKWPFAEENPFFPWYKKLRIYLFHESSDEKSYREHIKGVFEEFNFGSGGSNEGGEGSGSNNPAEGTGAKTPILKFKTDEGYFEQVRTRVLELKLSELDSLREQAAVKTKSHELPIPSAF